MPHKNIHTSLLNTFSSTLVFLVVFLSSIKGIAQKQFKCSTTAEIKIAMENVNPGVATFVQGNVGNRELIEHLISIYKFDAIFHFAAQSHVDNSFNDALSFTMDNTHATHVLVEACRKHIPNVEFIHLNKKFEQLLDPKKIISVLAFFFGGSNQSNLSSSSNILQIY